MEQESLTLAMPLTEEEQRDLVRREEYIEENLQTLFSVGKAFADIRDHKLYRETHRTFEDYCKDRWKISRPRAYQLIDASVVQENLSTNVDNSIPLPTNEAQTRALKKVPAEKQPELWSKAVEQNNGNVPTARQIVQVITTEFERKPKPDQGLNRIEQRDCPRCNGRNTVKIYYERGHEYKVECESCGEHFVTLWHLEHFQPQRNIKPEPVNFSEQPKTDPQPPKQTGTQENVPAGDYVCCFCGEWFPRDQLFWGDDDVTICRKCAAKAQIALLHPDDPEVIHECQQIESEMIYNFQPRRTSDLDKILRAGTLRIFRISEHEKKIKEYTKAKSTIVETQEAINWGSWKTFETFTTKKAMLQRVQELQQDDTIIFDGAF